MNDQEELELLRLRKQKALSQTEQKVPTSAIVEAVAPAVMPFGGQVVSNIRDIQGLVSGSKKPQEFLPEAGGVAGAMAAGMLPGGPVTQAAGRAVGAGVGEAAGQALEQKISGTTPQEPVKQFGKTVLKGAGKQIAGELAMKGLSLIPAGIQTIRTFVKSPQILREGLNKYVEFMNDLMTPKGGELRKVFLEKYGNKPATNVSDAKEFIENTLQSNQMEYTPELQAMRQMREQQMAQSVKPETARDIMQQMENIRQKGEGAITSKLPSSKPKKFQTMGDILTGLNREDLTYKDLLAMQKTARENAAFGKPNFDRTPEQKIYGELYHNLGTDLERTAQEGKFAGAHERIKQEGRAFNRRQFVQNAIESGKELKPGASVTRNLTAGEQVGYSKLANSLNSYTDDELARVFGIDTPYVKLLRDTSAELARRNPPVKGEFQEGARAYLSGQGKLGATLHPYAIGTRRFGIQKSLDQILTDRGFEGAEKAKLINMIYTAQKSPTATTMNTIAGKLGYPVGSSVTSMLSDLMGKQ